MIPCGVYNGERLLRHAHLAVQKDALFVLLGEHDDEMAGHHNKITPKDARQLAVQLLLKANEIEPPASEENVRLFRAIGTPRSEE